MSLNLFGSIMTATTDFLQVQAFQAITTPVLSRSRFAEIIGVSEGTVLGWCNKGLLETYKIGKHSLVNIEALRRQCDQKALG
jgi:hypothetical protein